MNAYTYAPPQLVDIDTVCAVTKLSKSTIYRLIRKFKFPASVASGAKRALWVLDEIEKWVASKAS